MIVGTEYVQNLLSKKSCSEVFALGQRLGKAYLCFAVSRFSSDQPHSDLPKKPAGSFKQGHRDKVNILSFTGF